MKEIILFRHNLGFGEYRVLPDGCGVRIENGCILCVYRLEHGPWNGKGLPPGGTVCEAFNEAYEEWRKVKILDHRGSFLTAVCRDDSDRLWWSNKFRPIRTPEQTAAEEKSKAINEMIRPFEAFEKISPLTVAEYLYNEGYRKFEIIDEPKS